jgi:hypothetical protein
LEKDLEDALALVGIVLHQHLQLFGVEEALQGEKRY